MKPKRFIEYFIHEENNEVGTKTTDRYWSNINGTKYLVSVEVEHGGAGQTKQ